MAKAKQMEINPNQHSGQYRRRHPRFHAIRPTQSGSYVVFALNEATQILVNTKYLCRILETANQRAEQPLKGGECRSRKFKEYTALCFTNWRTKRFIIQTEGTKKQ